MILTKRPKIGRVGGHKVNISGDKVNYFGYEYINSHNFFEGFFAYTEHISREVDNVTGEGEYTFFDNDNDSTDVLDEYEFYRENGDLGDDF